LPDPAIEQALLAAYRDGSWGKYEGDHVAKLQKRLADYHQVEFALVCGSGTFAIELALRACQVGPGDEVVLSAYDYPGNFHAVHAVGAMPVLVDVDPQNWNLDVGRLEGALGPATRAIIVSHLHGGVVPMRSLMALAAERRLRVIEDAAQQPGAIVQGRRAGTWGDVGVLSFGGSKLLTAGRGGALLTPHPDIHQRARIWLNRGNVVCPLAELQAAVLLPQLDQLDVRNARRAHNVRRLAERVAQTPGFRPFVNAAEDSDPAYYKVGFQFDAERFGVSRPRFVAAVRAEGVAFDEGFAALHVGRSRRRFRAGGDLAEASRAHAGTVILHHPILLGTTADIEQAALAVRKVQAHAHEL
jgi:dTDP-4-amino-4,6-dideoxygalactose transaminase